MLILCFNFVSRLEKDVRDEENFQIVTNDQRRKFVNKKQSKKDQKGMSLSFADLLKIFL